MEERLFADDAFFETMQRVKGQLLEGDVAGTLPPQVAEALALQVARSPRLAGELEAVRERSMASAMPVKAVAWRWTWGLGGGLVAAVAMVVAVVAGLRGHSGQAVPQVARVTVPAAACSCPCIRLCLRRSCFCQLRCCAERVGCERCWLQTSATRCNYRWRYGGMRITMGFRQCCSAMGAKCPDGL